MIIAALLIAIQTPVQDPRLDRLDPNTRATVVAIVDSARSIGLPSEPLVQRALEGTTKGAAGERIVLAVRRLAGDLGTVRAALGNSSTPPELEAAVAALRAGASTQLLAKLRAARRPPLTMALAVLALAPRARDADLVEFRRAVERDIALGAPPAAATSIRVNAGANTLTDAGPAGQPPRPTRP